MPISMSLAASLVIEAERLQDGMHRVLGCTLLQGPFEDELQAATTVAKTLKCKVADLLRSKVLQP